MAVAAVEPAHGIDRREVANAFTLRRTVEKLPSIALATCSLALHFIMHLMRQELPFYIVNGSLIASDVSPHHGESLILNETERTTWTLLASCFDLREPQHILFQIANGCFLVSSFTTDSPPGMLVMHAILMTGYLLYSTWAWNIICAPDIFSWTFAFTLLNMSHMVHSLYRLRPVSLASELEPVFRQLFQPFGVSRHTFKKFVSQEYAQIYNLHAGEAYALQNITRADRLTLLLDGKVMVISERTILHGIDKYEFLDSPEYESSRGALKDKFRVSIVAATTCRCITWQCSSLTYFLVKETQLAAILSSLVARDVTNKIYQMNRKLVTEKGILMDIRLPGVIDCNSKMMRMEPTSRILPVERVIKENGTVPNSFNWN